MERGTIEKEIREWLSQRELRWATLFVRKPAQTALYEGRLREFHHDDNPWDWVVVWSNKGGTEFESEGITKIAKPNEVILFNDKEIRHRPPLVNEGRWFARFDDVHPTSPTTNSSS